jgi:D-amino-acid dehydrogenase
MVTGRMTEPRDVAVIGAGVVGICCARALQRQGHRVTVFDPQPPGSGASFGNAGHIAVDHVRPLARFDTLRQVPRMLTDPLGPLALRWRDAPSLVPWLTRFALATRPKQVERGTTALAALLGGAPAAWAEEVRGSNLAGLFRAKGALVVYHSDSAFRAGAHEREIQRRHGVAVETMDGDAARARAPGLDKSIRHATYFASKSPTASYARSRRRMARARSERSCSPPGSARAASAGISVSTCRSSPSAATT